MTAPIKFEDITENFEFLDDWEDRYKYLIELGQSLPPLSDAEKNSTNKVSGCVSQVWLCVEDGPDGTMVFRGESDAMIVKGLVAVLIALYSGQSSKFVSDTDAIEVLDKLGLREHLTTQRANGLVAMVNRMRSEAKLRVEKT